MSDPVFGRLPGGGDVEMVHTGHTNGGEWRLSGKKKSHSKQKGRSEQRPGGGTQGAV